MTEIEMFSILNSINPTPGVSNLARREGNIWILPGWVSGSEEKEIKVKFKRIKHLARSIGVSDRVLYDVLQLGLTDISQRPKCPICGKERKFDSFGRGYGATCSSKSCISEKARREVTNLWKDEEYRSGQINTKKKWMNQPEYIEKFKNRAISQWSDKDYRKKQTTSHIEFCKNNPDKVFSGQCGTVISNKSINGELIYDSSWEKDFIEFCNREDYIISINRTTFPISYVYDNIQRNYFPDFEIVLETGIKLLVEIKCDWLLETDEKTKYKIEAGENFVKNSKDFSDYLVLVEQDLYIIKSKRQFKEEDLRKRLKNYIS